MRFIPPFCAEEISKRHYHEAAFQLLYCLKGWTKYEFEGQGQILIRVGSCWLEPAKIKHMVLDYSDDCELLEVVMPADFKTGSTSISTSTPSGQMARTSCGSPPTAPTTVMRCAQRWRYVPAKAS